jgi:hypothetical protein
MSIRAMNWAWSQRTGSPSAKVVLMKLADYADDGGFAFPSVARIAMQCEMSERTVQRHLRALEAHHFLTCQARRRPDGSPATNAYLLSLPIADDRAAGGGVNLSPAPQRQRGTSAGGVKASDSAGEDRRAGGDMAVTQTTRQPSHNHHHQPPPARCGQPDLVAPDKLPIADRAEALRRVRRFKPDLGQQLLDELAARMAVADIQNPLRYLSSLTRAATQGRFAPDLARGVAAQRASQERKD